MGIIRSCAECLYFYKYKTPVEEGEYEGQCRLDPPVVLFDQDYSEPIAAFPEIMGDCWCGAFIDKSEDEDLV